MIAFLAAAAAVPAAISAQDGFSTAVAACESWIWRPGTHAGHFDEFPRRAGLADKLLLQTDVPDMALPPPQLREALHTWRVPVGAGGYFLTVSDQIPFCHIIGGGPADFEPGTEAALKMMLSTNRWTQTGESRNGDLLSTQLVSTASKRFTMVVSRAASPGQRTDRVQVLATAQFNIDDQQ